MERASAQPQYQCPSAPTAGTSTSVRRGRCGRCCRAALGGGTGSLILPSLPVSGPGLCCVEKVWKCRPEILSELGVAERTLGSGLGVLGGITGPGCVGTAGAWLR